MNGAILLFLTCLIVLACQVYPRFWEGAVGAAGSYPVHNLNAGLSYTTIQEAINANETQDGDVIHVDAGTYVVNDTVYNLINKSVSLVGDGMENTTIICTENAPAFYVTSDHVSISGFTLRNGWHGVDTTANYLHITNCNISDNQIGIQMDSHISGHTLMGEVIEKNILINNGGMAIQMAVNDSIVSRNFISDNGGGISVFDPGSNNLIYGNTIRNTGPSHDGCIVGGHNNTIILNNFLNNTHQADSPFSVTVWDGRLNSGDLLRGGNYWSDYSKTNKYGIGTDPYVIDANNIDHQPLTGMVNIFDVLCGYDVAIISNSSLSNFQLTVSNESQATLDFTAAGENGTQGFCWVIVPQAVINYSQAWTVTLDGSLLQTHEYSVATNGTHWNFWIDYPQSTHQIQVKGVTILPEFPTSILLSLFIITTLLAIVLHKRGH